MIENIFDLATHHRIDPRGLDSNDCFVLLASWYSDMGLMLDVDDETNQVTISNIEDDEWYLTFPFTAEDLELTISSAKDYAENDY